MGADNKVVWSEGMFLRPQHFQQHDRYIERLVRERVAGVTPYAYGVLELKVSRELLIGGKFGLAQCRGILPDGTPFDLIADGNHPEPLEIGSNIRNEIVYLTLPERQPGRVEVATASHETPAARFTASSFRAFDAVAGNDTSADLEVGKLQLRYALESSERAGFVCLGVARIMEVRSDKAVVLDERYIPPALACPAIPALAGISIELQGLLHQRAEELAGRATQAAGGTAEIANFLLLQMINRYEPLIHHYAGLSELHPVHLYATLLEMAGEFSTFVTRTRRPIDFPDYRHDDLQNSFGPVMAELRQALSAVIDQSAVPIPLQERAHGVRVAVLNDKSLLNDASFVLAVKADVQDEHIRRNFAGLTTIGPVEQIVKLVNSALRGIPIRPLPVSPRQIPFHAGTVYFELDRKDPLWRELKTSAAFAFHIGGDFPGLAMEFWAIRR
ncbi:MAG TPA: type VI secretion system baseplate subunit TssK [Micropepsaceae bacterium]|nr:type VI secretion system baseplate subunit TssK [Micropepsaceae bacterium]